MCPGLLGSEDKERLKMKAANIYRTNTNKAKSRVEIVIPDKVEFKAKAFKEAKDLARGMILIKTNQSQKVKYLIMSHRIKKAKTV
jgi:hypothetical protein